MKKAKRAVIATAALVCCLILSVAGAAVQVEKGVVVVPTPGRVGKAVVEGCPGSVGATVHFITGVWPGKRFAVKSATWGSHFTLTPNHPAANLDIGFRTASGWVEFDGRRFGGEQGFVPNGALEALVCLSYGAPAMFTYKAG